MHILHSNAEWVILLPVTGRTSWIAASQETYGFRWEERDDLYPIGAAGKNLTADYPDDQLNWKSTPYSCYFAVKTHIFQKR